MLAVPGPLPAGDEWAFEVKWDGVRVVATVDGGRVLARGRSGRDMTDAYPELAELGRALGPTQAVLDGEVVAFGADGRPDFELLIHRMHVTDPAAARRLARTTPVRYMAFDLLYLDGRPAVELCYDERRALLEALPGLTVPESFHGDGRAVLAASLAAGLEGVVAKRRGSTYLPGRRSPDWVKVKNSRRQAVVIGGWEPGEGRRAHRIGALLVGVATGGPAAPGASDEPGAPDAPGSPPEQGAPAEQGGAFAYAGQVGTGFTEATLDRLAALLAPLRRDTPPFPDVPAEYARDAVWVEPVLVAEVEFGSWTHDDRMRRPSFKGLRDDVDPSETVRETAW
jgi:bifunctional non-homologous end joining protein LigD